jgi:hypothetical protein
MLMSWSFEAEYTSGEDDGEEDDDEEEEESSEEESDEEEEGGAEDEDEDEDYAELTKFRSRRSSRTTQVSILSDSLVSASSKVVTLPTHRLINRKNKIKLVIAVTNIRSSLFIYFSK